MNKWKDRLKSLGEKQSTRLISQLGICIFSLVVMIMAIVSFAWFIQNRDTSLDPLQMALKKPDEIIATATVHACIGADENGTRYFSKTAAAANDLKKYMLLSENYRQLLIHIHFEDPQAVEGISLTAATDTAYFMGDGNHPLLSSADGKGETYDNVLSSIIAFYVVDSEDATYHSNAAYKVASFGTPYHFIDKNDYSITNHLTLVDIQTVSDIYVVLDYDAQLVSKVFLENLDNLSFERPDGSFLDEALYVWDINLELTKE